MAPKRITQKTNRIPSLRHHKATGQGFVALNDKRHYLGRYGLLETKEKYDRLIAEWLVCEGQTDCL
ncbi:MAG: hypothetical protein ACYS18_05135 [Planctomycetota bacterium]